MKGLCVAFVSFSFGALRLARLDLSHNGMTSIAEGAFQTLHETLNELDLGYNDFQRFDDVFLDFRMLQYLGLAHNRLGRAFADAEQQLGHLFDSLQLLQVLELFCQILVFVRMVRAVAVWYGAGLAIARSRVRIPPVTAVYQRQLSGLLTLMRSCCQTA